jgi:hypothetical protein
MNLPHNWELDSGIQVLDRLPDPVVDGYVQASARIAWHITPAVEVSLSGYNLLAAYRVETVEPGTAPLDVQPAHGSGRTATRGQAPDGTHDLPTAQQANNPHLTAPHPPPTVQNNTSGETRCAAQHQAPPPHDPTPAPRLARRAACPLRRLHARRAADRRHVRPVQPQLQFRSALYRPHRRLK